MPSARVNDTELYYEDHGEGEPLLAIMGLAADTTAWMLQVPAWSQRFRTIVFDNRDVGQSGYVTDGYRIADMAEDAIALADELGLESFHLLGLSMGGMIAQELALAHPERVKTLTLAVTYGGAGRYGIRKGELWAADAAHKSREELVDELLILTMSEQFFENEQGVSFMRQLMLDHPHPQQPEGFARQLAAASSHEARDRLGALRMPVHIIGAEHDVLVPVWKSEELAELIPDAKLTVIPKAPHGVNVERADEFNSAVLEFLETAAPAVR